MKRYIVILILSFIFSSLFATGRQLPADSLATLGSSYYKAQRYMDALDVLGKAMNEADKAGNERAYLSALMTIGNIYTFFDNYDQALHYYITCLEKAEAIKDNISIAKIKNNMLMCYAMLGKYKEAEACYKSIANLDIGDENINHFYKYLNQALLAKARKDYNGALSFHTQAMKYAQNHNMDGLYIAAEMGQIGTAHEESGNVKEAEKWYLRCFDFSEKGRYIDPLTTSCERLADIYRKQGKDQLFVKYSKLYDKYSDSLFKQKEFYTKRSLVNIYESKIKDRHITNLKDKNQALIWIIVTIGILMVALIVLLVYIYKVNRRLVATQRLLIKKHQEHSHQLEVQNEIFTSIGNNSDSDSDDELLPKKQADILLMSIAHVMEDADTVCNPDFSLSTLAQLVGSNTKYVSWVINKNYGKNFKTYLNEYRIRTASQLLVDTNKFGNLTIAGIAEKVGFKSPASFHQAFKKIYAMTPAAYIKLAMQKDES